MNVGKLLNIIEKSIDGFSTFITEYNTNLKIGDIVYIKNGNYNSPIFTLNSTNLFTDDYIVLSVDNTTNRITLNIPYTNTTLYSSPIDCYITTNAIVNGNIYSGDIIDGLLGNNKSKESCIIGNKTFSTSKNLSFYNGAVIGALFNISKIKYDITKIPQTTIYAKYLDSSNINVISKSNYNDGYGYSYFDNVTFGTSNTCTARNSVIEHGLFTNVETVNPVTIKNCYADSINDTIKLNYSSINNGYYNNIIFNNCGITAGTITGGLPVTSITYHSSPDYISLILSKQYSVVFENIIGENIGIISDSKLNGQIFTIDSIVVSSTTIEVKCLSIAGYSNYTTVLPTIFTQTYVTLSIIKNGLLQNIKAQNTILNIPNGNTDSLTISNGEYNSCILINQLMFDGSIDKNSVWYDGVMFAGKFSNSIWNNGTVKNGTFTYATFNSGIIEYCEFINSKLNKTANLDTFWYDGYFINSVAENNINWNRVEFISGTWQRNLFNTKNGVTRNGIGKHSKPLYYNTYVSTRKLVPTTSSSALDLTKTNNTISIRCVTSKDANNTTLTFSAGQIIELDVSPYSKNNFINRKLFKRLTTADINGITNANGQANGVSNSAYFSFPFVQDNTYSFSNLGNVQARLVTYPNSVDITELPTTILAEIRLKSTTTGLAYGNTAGISNTSNAGLVPVNDTYVVCVYPIVFPDIPTTTRWQVNSVIVNSVNIGALAPTLGYIDTLYQLIPGNGIDYTTFTNLSKTEYVLLDNNGNPYIIRPTTPSTSIDISVNCVISENLNKSKSYTDTDTFAFS